MPSADQALLFDQQMSYWQDKLCLGDWRIERGLKPAKGAMASVEFNQSARLATYRIGDFGAEKITPDSLKKTALHECLHVLMHDLIETATDRGSSAEQIEAAEHRIINVLERILTRE
jgi:predicted polyphosphate/ATP-dependent NAD kinase